METEIVTETVIIDSVSSMCWSVNVWVVYYRIRSCFMNVKCLSSPLTWVS